MSKRVRLTPESKTNETKKQLLPSCCYFCKKKRITVYKSEKKPTNSLINKTQESLKKAATLKNDCVMLRAIKEGIK